MRILYVEDDPINRRVMSALMSRVGIELSEAVNGLDGLHALEAGDFDVVLMDLRMPVMDGLTAIRQIRNRQDRKSNVPIVCVTADVTASVRAECFESGADDVTYKPVDIKKLLGLIGEVSAKRSAAYCGAPAVLAAQR